MITNVDMIARIAVGALLGGIIGFERDIHGRQAGLRTHLLVAMASATFMVVSNHFLFFQGYTVDHPAEADVSRIAASVVSGIGFLAGGAILKTGINVQGLTTAAGLWLVAAIGLAAGGGMYFVATSVTMMGLIALTIFRLFEDKNDKMIQRYVNLQLQDKPQLVSRVFDSLSSSGVVVPRFDYEKRVESNLVGLFFSAHIPIKIGVSGLIEILENHDGVTNIHVKARD